MLTAEVKARRALMRGLGMLCFGGAFALPIVGTTAAGMVDLALSLAGLRYGVRITT